MEPAVPTLPVMSTLPLSSNVALAAAAIVGAGFLAGRGPGWLAGSLLLAAVLGAESTEPVPMPRRGPPSGKCETAAALSPGP
jgi:hypothetical protein